MVDLAYLLGRSFPMQKCWLPNNDKLVGEARAKKGRRKREGEGIEKRKDPLAVACLICSC